jgi:hypothetical protein
MVAALRTSRIAAQRAFRRGIMELRVLQFAEQQY